MEALRYQCLREVRQQVQPFQILVGPNGSGKSVFLDVMAFLGDLVTRGLRETVDARSESFYDLVWGRNGRSFCLALEAERPGRSDSSSELAEAVRYEVEVVIDEGDNEIFISRERLSTTLGQGAHRQVIARDRGKASFFPESPVEKSFDFELHPHFSSLATMTTLAIAETSFPALLWLKTLLQDGVKKVALDSELLRGPSPPGYGSKNLYKGLDFARLVGQVRDSSTDAYESWLRHVQTAMPDITGIRTIVRPEDKYRYLMIGYAGGLEVPQWIVSDGTLRLLALTFLAYLPAPQGPYLVEEPETGVHPTAIETIIQSLSSVYDGQVLITSHSPVVLGLPRPSELLCFQKSQDGATVIPGDEHPLLKEWRSGIDLSDLFAAGVLS